MPPGIRWDSSPVLGIIIANFSPLAPLETFLVAEREGNRGNSGSCRGNGKYIGAADP